MSSNNDYEIKELNRVHKTAIIDPSVVLRDFIFIGEGVIIKSNVRISNHCTIDRFTKIGENTNIQDSCYFPANTEIGKNCFFATDTRGTDERYPSVGQQIRKPLIFEDEVICGAGSMFVGGIKIGKGAIIAMGAVVMNDIEAGTVVGGIPAKPLYITDEQGKRPMTRADYNNRKKDWEKSVLNNS